MTGLRHDDERDDDRSHRRVSIMSSLDAQSVRNSPRANSKIPTFHFFPRGGRFDFINWFILPRITGNRLLGGENGVECCVLDESLKRLSLP